MQYSFDFDNIRFVHLQKERDGLLLEVEKLKKRCATIQGWYTRKTNKKLK